MDYDAFVSYSSNDSEWVRGFLVPHIESAGLTVCLDTRDFLVGRTAVDNMAFAVEHSRKVLLVVTPSWITSEWTAFESLLSQTMDPAGIRQKTMPLLLIDTSLPLRLRFLTYADFRVPSARESQFTRLLNSLRV